MKRFILLFVFLFTSLSVAQMNMAEVAARIKKLQETPVFKTSVTGTYLTASQLLGTNSSKGIISLPVATYPSLTELAYVKGVTSAIQTQMDLKAPLISPSFTTPLLGTPTSGVMTNVTGLPTTGLVDAAVTSTKMSTGAKTHSVVIQVADPGVANADFAQGYVLWKPSVAITITKVYLVPGLAYIAAASANDASVVVRNAAVGDIATLAIVTPLAAGSVNDMGTITNATVAANANVTIAVTTNGTADAPVQNILIEYTTID